MDVYSSFSAFWRPGKVFILGMRYTVCGVRKRHSLIAACRKAHIAYRQKVHSPIITVQKHNKLSQEAV